MKNYNNTKLSKEIAKKYCKGCESAANPANCRNYECSLQRLFQFAMWGDSTTRCNELCAECEHNDIFGCGGEDDFGLCLKQAVRNILDGKGVYD